MAERLEEQRLQLEAEESARRAAAVEMMATIEAEQHLEEVVLEAEEMERNMDKIPSFGFPFRFPFRFPSLSRSSNKQPPFQPLATLSTHHTACFSR